MQQSKKDDRGLTPVVIFDLSLDYDVMPRCVSTVIWRQYTLDQTAGVTSYCVVMESWTGAQRGDIFINYNLSIAGYFFYK